MGVEVPRGVMRLRLNRQCTINIIVTIKIFRRIYISESNTIDVKFSASVGTRGSQSQRSSFKSFRSELLLHGCGPNYLQWLSRKRNVVLRLWKGRDSSVAIFSSLSFSCNPLNYDFRNSTPTIPKIGTSGREDLYSHRGRSA